MTKLSHSLLALFLTLGCAPANAGSANGPVTIYFTYEYPGAPPVFFVHIGGTASSPAACGTATANGNRWVTRTDTPAGKSHMAVILMAKETGRTLLIEGKGSVPYPDPCETWSDTESITHVQVSD